MSWLADAARAAPDAPALITEAEIVSFAALHKKAVDEPLPPLFALRRPVGLRASADLPSLIRLHALLHGGHTVVPIHPRLTPSEADRQLALVAEADTSDALAILFTSGSTGQPRGVELSRAAFLAAATASAERLGWAPHDRWLLALPWAHVGGLSVIVRCLLARVPVVLAPATGAAQLLDVITRHQVTMLSLVPAQLAPLVRLTDRAPPSLRAVLLGGAAAPASRVQGARARHWPIATTYGLSESCAQVATLAPAASFDGSCGPALPGYDVRIVDGEIQVRSPSLLTRYHPDTGPVVDGDGYFHTRDHGRLDDRGHLHVLGRADDVIITGGEKVMPLEVEAVVRACPGVVDACVFPVADERFGQLVACAVVGAATDDELARHVAAHLARWKQPRRIARLDALPLLPSGKVARRALMVETAFH